MLAFLAWSAYTQTSQPEPLKIEKLHDDFYVIDGTSHGSDDVGNVAVYITGEGVILVDDRFDRDYDQIVAKVNELTSEPIRYVINTHHHGDHTGSNAKFLTSTVIIAHSNARKHMIDSKMPGPPPISFTAESSVYLGGKEVRAIYYGRGHTDGDIAVYFPAHRTVSLGDLMAGTNGVTNPVMDYSSGGSLDAWPSTLDGVLKLDLGTVIPGHGAITDREGLIAHRNKVAAIRDRMKSMTHDHRSKDEIGQVLLKEFDFKPINMRPLDGILTEFKN